MTQHPPSPPLRARVPGFGGLAGFARRDITPPVGIRNRNWGAATSDVAAGVHRPFSLDALALAASTTAPPLLLVGLDATHWRRVDDWERLQRAVLDALEIAPSQLIVNLSHTHSGPVLTAAHADLPGGEHLKAYMSHLAEATIAACREALDALAPASIDWTHGRSAIAVNRELDLDGRALVGFNPRRPADDTVLVGRVSAADGATLGTVVNFACHPTTLAWENHDLSPDYVGELRATVEAGTGAPCLFLQGASGDVSPRLQYSGDPSLADRHGRAIGLAVLSALETLPPPAADLVLAGAVESGAPLAIWRPEPGERSRVLATGAGVVELPLRPLATEAELEDEWSAIPPQSRDERLRRVRDLRAGYLDMERRPDGVDHPFWAARIGDAMLVAHPGEAYNWLQLELRRRFPGTPVLVLNVTNGPGFVYLPDAGAYARDAYAAWQTVLAPGALERLADAATDALQRLPDVSGF